MKELEVKITVKLSEDKIQLKEFQDFTKKILGKDMKEEVRGYYEEVLGGVYSELSWSLRDIPEPVQLELPFPN